MVAPCFETQRNAGEKNNKQMHRSVARRRPKLSRAHLSSIFRCPGGEQGPLEGERAGQGGDSLRPFVCDGVAKKDGMRAKQERVWLAEPERWGKSKSDPDATPKIRSDQLPLPPPHVLLVPVPVVAMSASSLARILTRSTSIFFNILYAFQILT